MLSHFSDHAPSAIQTDASRNYIGAVVVQTHQGKEHVTVYTSRSLTAAEKNYTLRKKKELAAVWSITKFRPYGFWPGHTRLSLIIIAVVNSLFFKILQVDWAAGS